MRIKYKIKYWYWDLKNWYYYFRYCAFRKHHWYMDQPADPRVGIWLPTIICDVCGRDASDKETRDFYDDYDPTP